MGTVVVREKYLSALSPFGDLQTSVDLALERYTIEQIAERLAELRHRDAQYRAKFGFDYPDFARRIASDETFVREVETRITKTWEADLADWEFCYEGSREWAHRLHKARLG